MAFGESINDIRKTFTDIQEIIKVEEHFLANQTNTLNYILFVYLFDYSRIGIVG